MINYNIRIYYAFLFFCMSAFSHAQSDDNYLKQLELEAENITENPSPDSQTQDNTEFIPDKTLLIKTRKDFEASLKKSYPESYQLFMNLTDEQKNDIYQEFSKGELLSITAVKIISVYINSH